MIPRFIICGVEHSGTTLLSDIFRQVPGLDSGFEVGVLLARSPRAFRAYEPFVSNMVGGWGIEHPDLDYICDCDSLDVFYGRLYERSRLIVKPCDIFDKTPRYFSQLEHCLTRFNGQYIALYKDPRAIVFSDFHRSGGKDWDRWYEDYRADKIGYLLSVYDNYRRCRSDFAGRALPVSLEDICLDTRKTLERIFAHVAMDFKVEYVMIREVRFQHTRAHFISSIIPFEYKQNLEYAQIRQVEEDFSQLRDWFYE